MKKYVTHLGQVSTAIIVLLIFCASPVISQTDTLHLNYHHTQILPHDSTQKKIDDWVKKLNGKHVDIVVNSYYHKAEFRKFSQQRSDELFLVLNRKARNLITIKSMGPKKGEDYQRTMVDIIYEPSITEAEKAEIAKKEKEAMAAEKEKIAAEKEKKAKEKEAEAELKKSKSEVVAEEQAKSKGKKTEAKEEKSLDSSVEEGKKEKGKKAAKPEKVVEVNGMPDNKPANQGVYLKRSEAVEFQSAKLILPITDDPELDSVLIRAVDKFWTFNKNISRMTYKEAKALAKTDPNVLIFIISKVKSKEMTFWHDRKNASTGRIKRVKNAGTVSFGNGLMLENGKGKAALAQYFPTYGEDHIFSEEQVSFAVSALNALLNSLVDNNISNNLTFNKPFKPYHKELESKTLVIPDFWVGNLAAEEISNYYKGKYEVVNYESWTDAILKKKDCAYIIIVPFPISGKYVYLHYLMDAKSGKVLYIFQPQGVEVGGFNVSKGNTGYINSATLKKYNRAFEGGDDVDESKEAKSENVKEESKEKAAPEKKEKKAEEKKEPKKSKKDSKKGDAEVKEEK